MVLKCWHLWRVSSLLSVPHHPSFLCCLSLGVVWPLFRLILRNPSNPTTNTDPLWCFTKLGLEPQPPIPSPPLPFVAFAFASSLHYPILLSPPRPPFPPAFPVATPQPSAIVRWVEARILVLAPPPLLSPLPTPCPVLLIPAELIMI